MKKIDISYLKTCYRIDWLDHNYFLANNFKSLIKTCGIEDSTLVKFLLLGK